MELNTYQKQTHKTVLNSIKGNSTYFALGLCGEAGEVAEHVKKLMRDGTECKDAIRKEAGDVLFYLAQLCSCYDLTLNEVAEANIKKLQSRKKRGMLSGSGDNR